MSNYHITYKPVPGMPEYIARVVSAHSVSEAMDQLGSYHTIRSITVQCEGLTAKGEPCQRFTHNLYCCEAHSHD